jgi:hypothetical protein
MDQNVSLRYQTFLITCWQEQDELAGNPFWRFRLETVRSDEKRLFTTLEEVKMAIETELKERLD